MLILNFVIKCLSCASVPNWRWHVNYWIFPTRSHRERERDSIKVVRTSAQAVDRNINFCYNAHALCKLSTLPHYPKKKNFFSIKLQLFNNKAIPSSQAYICERERWEGGKVHYIPLLFRGRGVCAHRGGPFLSSEVCIIFRSAPSASCEVHWLSHYIVYTPAAISRCIYLYPRASSERERRSERSARYY